MMAHPNQFPRIDIAWLLCLSANGALYRSFDRVIAAQNGCLLLAPMHVVRGNLSSLVDGCPVPWEEADEVLHTEWRTAHAFDVTADHYSELIRTVVGLAEGEWTLDFISINRSRHHVWRLAHWSGIRFACTADLVYE